MVVVRHPKCPVCELCLIGEYAFRCRICDKGCHTRCGSEKLEECANCSKIDDDSCDRCISAVNLFLFMFGCCFVIVWMARIAIIHWMGPDAVRPFAGDQEQTELSTGRLCFQSNIGEWRGC